MKTKTLALTNGVVGLAGGIILLLGGWFVTGGAINDVVNNSGASSTTGVVGALDILKIAILALGIIGAVHYKGDTRVGAAPSVLLIVGSAIALVPFMGWIGGIIAIVGGSLYLAKLKHFSANN